MTTAALLLAAALLAAAPAAPQDAPAPHRPVASIVSPGWDDPARRDAAHEVEQITERLGVRPGMTVADIGAGAGYDTVRLAGVVGPAGRVVAEDVTPRYLDGLRLTLVSRRITNVKVVQGTPGDPKLAPRSIDRAVMVHMYHEIADPYGLLFRLAGAFRPGGRLGIEELDRPTAAHGTPPALLSCELEAAGYRRLSLAPLQGGLGYFAVFAAPADPRPATPERAAACRE